MKKFYSLSAITAILLIFSSALFSQNVAINTTGTKASVNAILDLNSGNTNNKGFIFPSVTLGASLATFNPPITGAPSAADIGMMVYNNVATNQPIGFYYWNGATWVSISGGAGSGWAITGNAGTNPAVNYSGTTGAQDFVIRTNAIERMRVMAGGTAGIGTPTPKSATDVNGNMSIGTYAGVNAAPVNGVIISGQVGLGTNTPNASAALDVTSTSAGFLLPRMTAAQMAAIAAPAIGLMVLNNTTNCIEYWSGIGWQTLVCPCSGPPATPGAITGLATPCASSAGNVYSIAAVANATSYTWTVPAGATITAGTGTTSITVTFGTTSGNITVTASNSCGTSSASILAITLSTIPAAPATPSGTTTPILSSVNTYTVAVVAGATSYTWSSSNTSLAAITTGQGTTSVTVTTTATAGTFTICVYASNACGNSASSCLTVTSSACAVSHGTATFNPTTTGPTGTIQNWTVPCGINSVTITAYGAKGGTGLYGAGGSGAEIIGTFAVVTGEVIDIIVGQAGVGGSGPYYCGSGGGGSYVWNTASTTLPLIVAGGGGGSAYNSVSGGGSATTTPSAATGSGCGAGGAGGNGGAGGGGVNNGNISTGGGGGGWLTNGANGTVSPFAGGGNDPFNAGTGGAAGSPGGAGGFGGGGGCVGNDGAGGGGGGYNGGGGGNMWNSTAWGGGGGGGSYNGGTAQTNIAATRAAAGLVTIVY